MERPTDKSTASAPKRTGADMKAANASTPVLAYQSSRENRWIHVEVRDYQAILKLPDYCCSCLRPTIERWRPKDSLRGGLKFPVPLCGSCQQRWETRRRRIWQVGLSLLFAGIATYVGLCLAFSWRLSFYLIASAILPSVIALSTVVHFFGDPIILSLEAKYNAENKPRWVRFRNREFTRLLLDSQALPKPSRQGKI
jgi:hypothetical protein